MSPQIRLLLADDHFVVRIGLKSLLEAQPDMTVVGEANGGRAALELFFQLHPDVTLVDLRMPDLDGTEVIAAIRKKYPKARILVLTTYDNDEDIYRAIEAGAIGYLLKNADSELLISAVRQVYANTYKLPPNLATRLKHRQTSPTLSPRELEVLQQIVLGRSNKEIAAGLDIAENTVKNHIKTILDKLGVADRTQAATTALHRGLAQIK